MTADYSELIEYLDVKFNAIDKRFADIDKRFESLENRFTSLEGQVNQLPTRSYIDKRLAEFEGRLTTKILVCVYKTNRLVDMLKDNKTLEDYEYKELQQFDLGDTKS